MSHISSEFLKVKVDVLCISILPAADTVHEHRVGALIVFTQRQKGRYRTYNTAKEAQISNKNIKQEQ